MSTNLNRFSISFSKFSNLGKMVKEVTSPDITLNSTIFNFSGNEIKITGDTKTISDLSIIFFLKEDYSNYFEFLDWIEQNHLNSPNVLYDDIEHILRDNSYNSLGSFSYKYCVPTSISGFTKFYGDDGSTRTTFSVNFTVNDFKYQKF